MNIMCVCLFSALSRRVGVLQISIIIITMFERWIWNFYVCIVLVHCIDA